MYRVHIVHVRITCTEFMFQYLELETPGLTIEACIGKGRVLKLTFYQMEYILLACLTVIQILGKSKSYTAYFY